MKLVNLKKWMTVTLFMGVCFGFAACGDDDKTPDVTAVNGAYSGTMTVVEAPAPASVPGRAEATATQLDLAVTSDKVVFETFPIRDLVVKIIGGEEGADEVVDAVGKVSYEVAYTAQMSSDNGAVKMTLKPEPLQLELTIANTPMKVDVVISTTTDSAYTIASKKLAFTLNVDDVKLNNTSMGLGKFSLDFNLAKK